MALHKQFHQLDAFLFVNLWRNEKVPGIVKPCSGIQRHHFFLGKLVMRGNLFGPFDDFPGMVQGMKNQFSLCISLKHFGDMIFNLLVNVINHIFRFRK